MKVTFNEGSKGDRDAMKVIEMTPLDYLFNKLELEMLPDLVGTCLYYKRYILAYTLFFIAIGWATTACHWGIVDTLFSLQTSWLVLVLYFVLIITILEKRQTFKVVDWNRDWYSHSVTAEIEPVSKNAWKLSVAWTSMLAIILSVSFYFIRQYAGDYSYECQDVFMETEADTYHFFSDCDYMEYSSDEVQAYKAIEHGCKLCEACKERAEDLAPNSIPSRYQP